MPKDILELQIDKQHYIRSAEEILQLAEKDNDRVLTAEEQNRSKEFLNRANAVQAEIDEINQDQELRNRVRKEAEGLARPQARVTRPQDPTSEPSRGVSIPAETPIEFKSFRHKYGSLKAFSNDAKGEEAAFRTGMWMRAAFIGDRRAQRFCHDVGLDFRNAQGESPNTAGGYLVPEEFSAAVITLRETYGIFRKYAKIYPMGRDVLHVPRRVSGITAQWVAENPSTGIVESDKVWDSVQLVAKKLAALTLMSTEISEDANINMADDLASEFAYAFALQEDQAGFIGTGTSTYGMINGLKNKFDTNTGYAGYYAAASGQPAMTNITATTIAGWMGALPQYAHVGAKFYCSQPFFDTVFSRLAANAGGNTVQTLSGEFRPAYLGYEIVTSQVLPLSPSQSYNGVSVAYFGRLDLAAALGERRGIQIMRSDDRYFELDQIGLKATARMDINVHDIGNTTTAGPIVALGLTT